MLRKSKEYGNSICAVTKVTSKLLYGIFVYNDDPSKINKTFQIKKDKVTEKIDEFDFTKTLDSY